MALRGEPSERAVPFRAPRSMLNNRIMAPRRFCIGEALGELEEALGR